jgi:hypothetical protein
LQRIGGPIEDNRARLVRAERVRISNTETERTLQGSSVLTQGSLHDQSPEIFRVPKQVQAAMMDPTGRAVRSASGSDELPSRRVALTVPTSVDESSSLGSIPRMRDFGHIRCTTDTFERRAKADDESPGQMDISSFGERLNEASANDEQGADT